MDDDCATTAGTMHTIHVHGEIVRRRHLSNIYEIHVLPNTALAEPLALRNAHTVTLRKCPNIESVKSQLKHVKRLRIFQCPLPVTLDPSSLDLVCLESMATGLIISSSSQDFASTSLKSLSIGKFPVRHLNKRINTLIRESKRKPLGDIITEPPLLLRSKSEGFPNLESLRTSSKEFNELPLSSVPSLCSLVINTHVTSLPFSAYNVSYVRLTKGYSGGNVVQTLSLADKVDLAMCTDFDNEISSSLQSLSSVSEITLSSFPNVKTLSNVEWEGATSVSLSTMSELVSLSPAIGQNIQSVSIHSCASLIDVSVLATAQHVTLANCEAIVDVSALANVRELELLGCINLECLVDFERQSRRRQSPSWRTLKIRSCPNIVRLNEAISQGLSSLHTLEVDYEFPTVNGSSSSISSFSLSNSYELLSVPSQDILLDSASSLSFLRCESLRDLTALQSCLYLRNLDLFGCIELEDEDLECIRRDCILHTLDLSYCHKVSDVSGFESVHTLRLCGTSVSDASALESVYYLDLSACQKLETIFVAPHTLVLNGCLGITNINDLGKCHELRVANCYNLQDISLNALRNVHTLDFTDLNPGQFRRKL